jgi:hypothetical protein
LPISQIWLSILHFALQKIVSGPGTSVARWFVFKPKIQIWENFIGSCNGRCWYIFWTLGLFYGLFVIFYGHLVSLVVIWYIFPVLVFCIKKNLATLVRQFVDRQFVVHQSVVRQFVDRQFGL